MYDLGIIGGMGPLATVSIYEKIVQRTKATRDQEHMSILILNKPSIPDRTTAILNNDLSPVRSLNASIQELISLGVKNFIIACNTAHYFVNQLEIPSAIHFINMINEALIRVKQTYPGANVVLLSTRGTIRSNIYKASKYADGQHIIYPEEEIQEAVMDIIYKIKTGIENNDVINKLKTVMNHLEEEYSNCVFLFACTELSILASTVGNSYKIIDAADSLVEAAILKSGYELK